MRCVLAVLSWTTAALTDLAVGPYSGKKTGENALLRSIKESLTTDDIAVMDRYYCSFMMLALLLNQGTHHAPGSTTYDIQILAVDAALVSMTMS